MRSAIAASLLLAFLIGTADATECPPGALGVSRTLVLDPSEHARVGSVQYGESLPLRDREVVLTFDDGPLPPYHPHPRDARIRVCEGNLLHGRTHGARLSRDRAPRLQ